MQSLPDIYFKSIDLNSIENVEDNAEAVTFDILLNLAPSAHWLEEFEYLYARSHFPLKPPIHVKGDRMHIMYLPRYSDELQRFINFLSDVLARSTQEARRTIEIQQTDEKELVKSNFRAVLAKLDVSKVAVAS